MSWWRGRRATALGRWFGGGLGSCWRKNPGGIWESEDGGLDASFNTDCMQLLPVQGWDILTEGRRAVGRVAGRVEEVKRSKQAGLRVAECDDVGPSNVAGCVGSLSGKDSNLVAIVDITVGVSCVLVPFGPPSCCRVWFVAVTGVSGQEVNIIAAGNLRIAAVSVGFVGESEIDGAKVPARAERAWRKIAEEE